MSNFYAVQSEKLLNEIKVNASLEKWSKKGEDVALRRYAKIVNCLSGSSHYKDVIHIINHLAEHEIFSGTNYVRNEKDTEYLFKEILSTPDDRVLNVFFSNNPFLSNRDRVEYYNKTKNIAILNYIEDDFEFNKVSLLVDAANELLTSGRKEIFREVKQIKFDKSTEPFFREILAIVCKSSSLNESDKIDLIVTILGKGFRFNYLEQVKSDNILKESISALIKFQQKEAARYILKFTSIPVDLVLNSNDTDFIALLMENKILKEEHFQKSKVDHLYAALNAKDQQLALELYKKGGFDPFTKSPNKHSPFTIACYTGLEKVIDEFLKHPKLSENINKFDLNLTPLMAACETKQSTIAKKLLSHNADPFIENAFSKSSFSIACKNGLEDIVDEMLKNPELSKFIDLLCHYNSLLRQVMENRHSNIAKKLLKLLWDRIDPFSKSEFKISLFKLACNYGLEDIVEVLLQHPKSSDFNYNQTLEVACERIYSGIAKKLLQRIADPFSQHSFTYFEPPAFYNVCVKGMEDVLDVILQNPECSKYLDSIYGCSPLGLACMNGYSKVAIKLLQKGANPLTKDFSDYPFPFRHFVNNSPFDIACRRGFEDVVDAILRHPKYSKKIMKRDLNSPLGIACANKHPSIALKLLKRGANPFEINKIEFEAHSAFYVACANGLEEVVDEMLQHPECSIHFDQGEHVLLYKRTPLYAACENKHINIVKKLLEKGANPFSENTSTFYIAWKFGLSDVIDEIKKHPQFAANSVKFVYTQEIVIPDQNKNSDKAKEVVKREYFLPIDFIKSKNSLYFNQFSENSHFKEKGKNEFHIKWEYPPEVFEEYLKFDLEITYENFKALIVSADYFEDEELIKKLEEFVNNHPDVSNWKKYLPVFNKDLKKNKLENI